MKHILVHLLTRILQDRNHAFSIQTHSRNSGLRHSLPGQFQQRGIEVDRLNQSRCALPRLDPRTADQNRNPGGLLVVGVLAPLPVIPQMPTVIPPKNNEGILCQPQLLESRDHLTNLRIRVTRRRVIPMNQVTGKIIWKG